ncbi:MAG: glycosyltransferase family 2 protein, partial [Gracilimonas sp.]
REIFWGSGAALAIRKNVFLSSGGFDEDFTFHMEEIDLCWRLQNQEHRIMIVPESVVYHLGGGSLPMGSPRKVYYNFRNSLFMLWKNYSSASLKKRFILRLWLDVIAAYKALFFGKPKEWLAITKAHIHFFRDFRKVNDKRKKLQKKRIVQYDPETMMSVNLIWQYFFKGVKKFRDLNL